MGLEGGGRGKGVRGEGCEGGRGVVVEEATAANPEHQANVSADNYFFSLSLRPNIHINPHT